MCLLVGLGQKKLELRKSQVQTMLELNEAIAMEKVELILFVSVSLLTLGCLCLLSSAELYVSISASGSALMSSSKSAAPYVCLRVSMSLFVYANSSWRPLAVPVHPFHLCAVFRHFLLLLPLLLPAQEELLTRAVDLLKKARGDCLRLGQAALLRRASREAISAATTADGDRPPSLEDLHLSSFGNR